MEFGPRHPHALPPTTSPDRLSCGAAVRRSGPVSPPDRVPARAGTPRATARQTTPWPISPSSLSWVGLMPRAPQPGQAGGAPRAGSRPVHTSRCPQVGHRSGWASPLRTHRLPVQGQALHRRLAKRGTADSQGRRLGGMVQPVGPHDPRLGHRDMQEPALEKIGHRQRQPLGRGGRVGLLLPGRQVKVTRSPSQATRRAFLMGPPRR